VNINKSLSTLGQCIHALGKASGKTKGKGVITPPFRDSNLTWLIKDCLCGNSKTGMMAALSPASVNYLETLSTLRFAASAKKVKTVATINEDPAQVSLPWPAHSVVADAFN